VYDHCAALDLALQKGTVGEVYNIGGNNEWKNIGIVRLILQLVGKPESLITFVKDRLGHDRRYAIDATKINDELGWTPAHTFESGLQETVAWYLSHRAWWQRVMTGDYVEYYRMNYEHA
jgi:dTDP-glucose 4,6-dehydratase